MQKLCGEPNFKLSIKLSFGYKGISCDLEKIPELWEGRSCRPKLTPAEQRFCHFCKDKVEDEVHSIVDCSPYSEIRQAKGVSSAQIFVNIFKSRNEATLLILGQLIEKVLDAERTDRKATVVSSDPYNGTVRFNIIRYVCILFVFFYTIVLLFIICFCNNYDVFYIVCNRIDLIIILQT